MKSMNKTLLSRQVIRWNTSQKLTSLYSLSQTSDHQRTDLSGVIIFLKYDANRGGNNSALDIWILFLTLAKWIVGNGIDSDWKVIRIIRKMPSHTMMHALSY